MTITEMIRSIGEKVLLFFVALCLLGVFSSISFAEEATKNKPAPETSAAETPHSAPPGKIERAGESTKRGVKRAGEATGKGIERGADATKRGVKRAGEATGKGIKKAGEATGRGIKKAGEAIEKTFSGED